MTPKWEPVDDSKRIVAEAYLADEEKILVRFPDGTEWWYHATEQQWEDFQAASRGQYISDVLNGQDNSEYEA